jgi:hypothetical protein
MRAHGHISFTPREKPFLDTQLRRGLNIKADLIGGSSPVVATSLLPFARIKATMAILLRDC